MFLGQVVKLSDLVDYQERAVVSRTIIDEEKGTVTLFSFWEYQGLSEHTAPYNALVHILDGQAEISISGKTLDVKAGEIVLMPANEPHSLKAKTKFKMRLTFFRLFLKKIEVLQGQCFKL